jgi:phage terminase large subunit-like protein
LLGKVLELEKDELYKKYKDKVGEIVSGEVYQIWKKEIMVLDEEGLPVVAYPNSAERMVPATQKFYEGVVNQSFTHDGDERLARHIANCVTKQSSRGVMVAKASSRRKVDAAVAAIFGYDRATQPIERTPAVRYFSVNV